MKVLIITRLYTALTDSIKARQWQPKGMPAYCKLLEALSRRNDMAVDAVCLGETVCSGIDRDSIFKFPGLRVNFYVIPCGPAKGIFQFWRCLSLVLRNNYDFIYVDRGHVVFGAIFASFFKKKVVVRFFGIGSLIKRMRGLKKWFKEPIMYLSYKAPFRYIIYSKDGSDAGYFHQRYMNKKVSYEILLNGVDKTGDKAGNSNFIRTKYGIPEKNKIILFLGRLTKEKGAHLFIKSLSALHKTNRNFFALIVGDGPLREQMESEASENGIADLVKFKGGVAHDIIYDYYNEADVFVSLNSRANLCNTVLEAINAGKCIVTFKKDEIDHTDEDTESLLSGSAILINKRKAAAELPAVLAELLSNDGKIKELSQKTQILSEKLLPGWEERINYEIELFRRIGGEK